MNGAPIDKRSTTASTILRPATDYSQDTHASGKTSNTQYLINYNIDTRKTSCSQSRKVIQLGVVGGFSHPSPRII